MDMFSNLFIADLGQSRIDAISLDKQYHTVIYSNHENETGIMRPIALDLDTVNGYDSCLRLQFEICHVKYISTSFVYWIDLGGGQVPMKIARVRFDGKQPENIVVENLLKPNYIIFNLDLHCVFWSDVGLQRVRVDLFISDWRIRSCACIQM